MRHSSLLAIVLLSLLMSLSASLGWVRAQNAPKNLSTQPAIDSTPQPLSRLIKLELANQSADNYTVLFEDQMTKMLRKSAFTRFPDLGNTPLVAKTSTQQLFNQGCKRIAIHVSPINSLNDPQTQLNIAMNVCPDGQAPSSQMPELQAARFYNQHPIPQLPKALPR